MAKNFLTIEGEGIDVEYVALTAKQAKQILKDGITETDLDDLVSGSDTESGVCSASVMVGGTVVRVVSLDEFQPTKLTKLAVRKGWFLVKEQIEKGTFRKIKFSGRFDPKKLQCSAIFYELNGIQFGYLDISYADEGGDFVETHTKYGDGWLILNPEGERLSFEVLDCDGNDNNRQGENKEADPEGSDRRGRRTYRFTDTNYFWKFIEWTKEDLQPQIDEGLNDISRITFSESALEVYIEGKSPDLSFLPNPELGWAEEAFGEFTITDE